MSPLHTTIQELSGGSDLDIHRIYQALQLVRLPKGRQLLQQGAHCQHYYFVEKGALRLFYKKEEKEYTVWMATPGQIFTELNSYLYQLPALVSIVAVEDSEVYTIAKRDSDQLAVDCPAYNTLLRRTVEEAFASMSKNVMGFQSEDANQRYQRMAAESNWLRRFPLKYLSSFIGITQSSLSRLRANRSSRPRE